MAKIIQFNSRKTGAVATAPGLSVGRAFWLRVLGGVRVVPRVGLPVLKVMLGAVRMLFYCFFVWLRPIVHLLVMLFGMMCLLSLLGMWFADRTNYMWMAVSAGIASAGFLVFWETVTVLLGGENNGKS